MTNQPKITKQGINDDWDKLSVKNNDWNCGLTADEVKSFYDQQITKLIESLVPEDGIKWMQEGSVKSKKGYTDSFNFAIQQIKQRIKESGY